MNHIFIGLLVLLAVSVVMALPPQILGPLVAVGFVGYLFYDRRRKRFNQLLLEAFDLAIEIAEDSEAKRRLERMAGLRRARRFIEAVAVTRDTERLLVDEIRQRFKETFDTKDIAAYLLEWSHRIACGETYDELEEAIVEIKTRLNEEKAGKSGA